MTYSDRSFASSLHRSFLARAKMYCRLVFVTLVVFVGYDLASGQQHIPSETTAAELWNPWTWFWPYAKAAAEGYRDYYDKAQKATNELYQQIYKTNAFPWVTGNWNLSGQSNQVSQGGNGEQTGQGGNGEQTGQGGNGEQTGQGAETQSNQDQAQEGEEKQPGGGSGTEAQVEGNVQDDGTADAQANANVEGEEVNV